MIPKEKPKFKIGDHVKISESKLHFAKGYQSNFSHEYFVIAKGTFFFKMTSRWQGSSDLDENWHGGSFRCVDKQF